MGSFHFETHRLIEAHAVDKFRVPYPGIPATAVIDRAAVELLEVVEGRFLMVVTDLRRGPQHPNSSSWPFGPAAGEDAEIVARKWELWTGLERPAELERKEAQ